MPIPPNRTPSALKKRAITFNREQKARQDAFLEAYSKLGTIRAACEAVGIDRQTILNWREKDAQGFRERFETADLSFTEALETIAHQRAANGSDNLLMFTLKKRKPEYRDGLKVEHSGRLTLDQLVTASLDTERKG
jgi:hypothetical protein